MGFDRRIFLSALAAFVAWPGRAAAEGPLDALRAFFTGPKQARAAERGDAGVRYITPEGRGRRDGRSWDSAAQLRDLPTLIAGVGAGGRVLIAADRGRYEIDDAITLEQGGASGRPVLIKAVNAGGAEAAAEIWGNRTDPFNAEGETGAECFRFRRGADHLAFKGLHFRNVGNGCFRIGAPIEDLTIEDCSFRNVYRFIENTVSGDEDEASLSNFIVRRCRGSSIERSFLRIRYRSNNGVIEDCRADSEGNEGDPFAVGCALEDEAHTIRYRRCVMENFRQNGGSEYWNADGFSDEEDNYDIRYEYCEARGATDAGFDCKSQNVVFDHCLAEGNKINIKIWSPRSTIISCTSRNPNWRGRGQENGGASHFWYGHHAGLASRIRDLVVEDNENYAVFWFEGDDIRVQVQDYQLACGDSAEIIAVSEENKGCTVAFVPDASAPVSRTAPAIAGTASVGQALTVAKGLWAAYPRPSYEYQWRSNGAPIAGATRASYALVAADRGATLTITVTARNSAGAASANSAPLLIA